MLWHTRFPDLLALISRVLKPGGQMLFFEPNLRWPGRMCNEMRARQGDTKFSLPYDEVIRACSEHGFTQIEMAPNDLVSCRFGARTMQRL
jgi:hypothetical protein